MKSFGAWHDGICGQSQSSPGDAGCCDGTAQGTSCHVAVYVWPIAMRLCASLHGLLIVGEAQTSSEVLVRLMLCRNMVNFSIGWHSQGLVALPATQAMSSFAFLCSPSPTLALL